MNARRSILVAGAMVALGTSAALFPVAAAAQDEPPVPTGVVGWGYSNQETAPALEIPLGLADVVAVAAGGNHALALQSAGTVVAWGTDREGQASVPADLPPVRAIAAGGVHSLAVTVDGQVLGWGHDNYGQATPPADLSDVVAVEAGFQWSMALRADGTVVAWGHSPRGETDVPTGLTDVIAISAGRNHGLALLADGTVVGWGQYFCAGADGGQPDPLVPPGIAGVTSIAAGENHSLALLADGSVVEWGPDGFNAPTAPPALGPPIGLTNVTDVVAGNFHSLALRDDGTVVGWMTGTEDGGCSFDDGQALVPDGLTGVVALAGGFLYSLAVVEATLPTVTQDPVDQSVTPGQSATFGVAANAVPAASVQWETSVDGGNFMPIPGATDWEYTLVANPSDNGSAYRAVLSNAAGSVTSASARLTVIAVPTELPATGFPDAIAVAIAVGLVGAGLALVVLGRRRSPRSVR